MQSLAKQRGLTTASMMMIGVLVALIAITLIKLFPAYYDDYSVKRTLQSVVETPGANKMSPKELRSALTRRLDVNRVGGVKEEHITITKEDGKILIAINYEVRTPLYGNLDGVSSFSHSAEIKE